jgi:hypothetical protein
MKHHEWMLESERLMNLMESSEYKSDKYHEYRKSLLAHLAQKPSPDDEDDDDEEPWTMTTPAPL